MLKLSLALLACLAPTFFAAQWVGIQRWTQATEQLQHQLRRSQFTPSIKGYIEGKELIGLPLPVQLYFETVLSPGQEMITSVRISHSGEFNMSETDQQW